MTSHRMRFGLSGLLIIAGLSLLPDMALASTTTVGGSISNVASDVVSPLSGLIVRVCFLGGFISIASGIYHLTQSAHGRHQVTKGSILIRFLAGAALACIPDIMGAGVGSLWTGSYSYSHTMDSPGTVSNCVSLTSSNANALTCVAKNFGVNVVPVGIDLAFILSYLGGLILGANCLYKLMHAANSGQKPEIGKIMGTFLIACILTFLPNLIVDVQSTLGTGTSAITSDGSILTTSSVPSLLAYSGDGTSSSVLTSFSDLVSWLFVACVLFGVLSVLRGLLVLKHCIEGSNREAMTGGFLFIIGGTGLTNMKAITCIFSNTFLGNGLGFCS